MTETDFRNAMNTHGPAVYRLALCRTQDPADAEDVYQEVFLRLWKQETADWDGERTKAWLLRTTVNRCADLHRFRMRRPTLPLEAVAELSGETAEEGTAVWEAVARLPEKLRIPIHLHYGEGYSSEEIAALLGVPAATVRTRLHRARARLKEFLGGDSDEA